MAINWKLQPFILMASLVMTWFMSGGMKGPIGQLWNGRPSDAMMHAAKTQLEKILPAHGEAVYYFTDAMSYSTRGSRILIMRSVNDETPAVAAELFLTGRESSIAPNSKHAPRAARSGREAAVEAPDGGSPLPKLIIRHSELEFLRLNRWKSDKYFVVPPPLVKAEDANSSQPPTSDAHARDSKGRDNVDEE